MDAQEETTYQLPFAEVNEKLIETLHHYIDKFNPSEGDES